MTTMHWKSSELYSFSSRLLS